MDALLKQTLDHLKMVLDEAPLSVKHGNPVFENAIRFYREQVPTHQIMRTKRRMLYTPIDERTEG